MKVKISVSLPKDKVDAKHLTEKVLQFYQDLYQLLGKNGNAIPDHKHAHYLRMSFEDDFDEKDDSDDNILEEDDILDGYDIFDKADMLDKDDKFKEDDEFEEDDLFEEEYEFEEENEGNEDDDFFNK